MAATARDQRVEELIIRARTEGISQAERDLQSLANAHGRAGDAANQNGASNSRFGRSMRDPIAAIEDLDRKLVGSVQAFNRFESDLRKISRAATDSRADLAGLARTQENVIREFSRSAGFKISATTDVSGLHRLIAGQKELTAETRLAVRQWLENASAMEQANARAARLRGGFDDIRAAQDRLNEGLAEANRLRAAGAFDDEDLTRRTRQLNEEFDEQSRRLGVANGNLRLTSGQVQGLGYQINVVGTMLAMGASPFQIIASQAGQVVQVLQEGGGIKASLAAIGSSVLGFAKSIGPVGWAIAGLSAAAVAFGLATRRHVEPVEDIINRQSAAVTKLRAAYGLAAKASEDYGSRAQNALTHESRRDLDSKRKQLLGDLGDLEGKYFTGIGAGVVDRSAQSAPLRKVLDDLKASAKSGLPDFIKAREELAKIAETDPNRNFFGFHPIREWANTLLDATKDSAALQQSLGDLGDALSEFARRTELGTAALKAARDEMAQFLPAAKTQAQQIEDIYQRQLAGINMAGGDDRDIQSALRKASKDRDKALGELGKPAKESLRAVQDSLNNLDLSPLNRQIAETTQEYDRRIEAYKEANGEAGGLADLLAEKETALAIVRKEGTKAENVRRAEAELALKAVNDLTVGQKAATEGQHAYNAAIAEGHGETYARARAAEASTLSLAQAERESADALRQSQTARDQAGLEGYAAQVAAINVRYGEQIALAQGSEAAVRNLTAARDLDLQALQASTQKSLFADQSEQMRLLQAEAGLIGQTDAARRIALSTLQAESELRRQGIDLNSTWGRTYVENARQIAAMENALDKQTQAFESVRDAAKGFFDVLASGEGSIDGILKAAGQMFGKLSSSGFDRIWGLLGSGKSASGDGGGLLSALLGSGGRAGSGSSSNAPASAFVPVPTPAMRQASAKLAEGVTQSVSSNLLSSFLGSGKSQAHISGLNTQFATAMTSMLEAAPDAVRSALTINSGFRSVARQAELFDVALKKYGSVEAARKWVAPPGNSQHNKGMAADLGYTNVSAREWVHANAGKYGLAFPLSNENWHIELAGARGGKSAASPIADQRIVAKGVEQGLKDYGRTAGPESYQNGKFDAGTPGNPSGGRQLSGGQQALLGISGLVGAFSGGYQSGSPVGGLLNGAMGGFEVGSSLSFLGSAGGPIGAGIGAVVGIIGGLLGKRKQKKQEQEEARRQWDGMQPQYEAYRRYLLGEESGNLRADFQNIQTQFNQFQAASVKAGNGDLAGTARSFYAYVQKQLADVRESFSGMAADLAAGAGLDGPFAKGKSAIKQLQKQLLGYIDDVEIAYFKADNGLQGGAPFAAAEVAWKEQRDRAVALAKQGAQNQALATLNPAKELSAVESNLRSLEGAAQQLLVTLPKLGMGLEETARRVAEEFAAGKAGMRGDFEKSMGDRLLGLQGKGYLTDAREMIAEFHQFEREASLLGADPSGFAETFRLSAQDIVDGAELTGDAFKELIQRFPELAGVVKEFSAAAAESAKELAQTALDNARSGLDRSYQRETDQINELLSARRDEASELESTIDSLKGFANGIADFRKSLLVDDSLSNLDPAARLAEARRQFMDLSARAQAGDEDARSKLTGAGQEYLTEARDFYASSQGYYDAFDEVRRTLDQSESWARSQLSTSETQLSALKSQIKISEDLLETNRKEYEAMIGLNEGIKSLAQSMKDFAAAAAKAREQGITVPGTAGKPSGDINNGWTFESAPNYLAKNADVAAAIRNGETFGLPAGMAPEVYASAHYGLFGMKEGRQFFTGGYTGGSSIYEERGKVHGKEFVMDAPATSAIGVSTLEAMRQTRRLPALVADPYPRGELPSRASGESGMAAELRALKATVEKLGDQLAMVLHGEGEETRNVLRKGTRIAKQTKDLAELDAA